jgi:ATP-dependent Clp protease ATP-binding subunit ClpA
VDTVARARAGLAGLASGTAAKPRGILFFCGPSGVGKTLLAKKLAEFLFGNADAFTRFDMSEFMEPHTVHDLIGAPPSFVGYEAGGRLTNAVMQKPFSVLLFDEIEKAHPRVLDVFLQILDDGRLTDGLGQTAFFSETIIIFTSNIGTRTWSSTGKDIAEVEAARLRMLRDELTEAYDQLDDLQEEKGEAEGEAGSASSESELGAEIERLRGEIQLHFIESVESYFAEEISRPELLNRIGANIVPFNYLDDPQVKRRITHSHLERMKREFGNGHQDVGWTLEYTPEVIDWIVSNNRDLTSHGGRGITQALDTIVSPLTGHVLQEEEAHRTNRTFHVTIQDEELSLYVA